MTVRPSPPHENHLQQFSLTGARLDDVVFIAEGMAEDYFGASFEPLLTWSKAVPNYVKGEGDSRVRDGWRVTFQYRCRPRPLPERTSPAAGPDSEGDREGDPFFDGDPADGPEPGPDDEENPT